MALNKIDDNRFEIIPKDTKSNPIDALKVSKELYENGVKIIIGPFLMNVQNILMI